MRLKIQINKKDHIQTYTKEALANFVEQRDKHLYKIKLGISSEPWFNSPGRNITSICGRF